MSSLGQLSELAKSWLSGLSSQHILLLEGEMGSGKTQFCKSVLSHLGMDDATSPTFSLIHTFETPHRTVHHLDLYRLENEEDLESTGFWDLLASPSALFLIEWGDRLEESTLRHGLWKLQRLKFTVKSSDVRLVELTTLT